MKYSILLAALVVLGSAFPSGVRSATGDLLGSVPVSSGSGRPTGLAFDGTNLYYTRDASAAIFKVDMSGTLLASIPTTDYACGGPLAWDGTCLWTTGYGGCSDLVLHRVDPADGSLVSSFDISGTTASSGADGLDWFDSKLVLSAEATSDNTVAVLDPASGAVLSEFQTTPKPPCSPLSACGTSGVSFDGNCYLWHLYPAANPQVVVQTDLAGLETGLKFSPVPGIAEDLALDRVTFAPKTALWGITITYSSPRMYAFEVPDPTCAPVVHVGSVDLLHDAFPFNEDPQLPGTLAFDTTTALVKTGRNTAAPTGDASRLDIPGDSLVAYACGGDLRLDFVFRILPGPGNYAASSARTNPTTSAMPLLRSPASQTGTVVEGDVSFWGQYLENPGAFGTPGGHHGGTWWDANTWNSARCDTAETNLFPAGSGNLPGIRAGAWSATYHEAEPKYAVLGILKNRCFLIDPSQPATEPNIACDGTIPGWASSPSSGFDGNPTTREYTKIIPDGLLTPGSHVEYFLRASHLSRPTEFGMTPDTNRVTPQPGIVGGANPGCASKPLNGAGDTDGHRWESFGVLPDCWKDSHFGGHGLACMLYLDLDDGHGDERSWVIAAEAIHATTADRYGSHNGWHVSSGADDPNDPANFVVTHRGQAGSTWDMYGIRGVDDPTHGFAGSIGSRLAATPAGSAAGKKARIGPTPTMLWTYYRLIYATTGRWDDRILGPVLDRSQDDVGMLMAFRNRSVGGVPRGCFVEGAGFAQSEDASHPTELGQLFGAQLASASLFLLNPAACANIETTPMTSSTPNFGAVNPSSGANDVLRISSLIPTSTEANYFTNFPGEPHVVASTAALPFETTYWTGLLDAWPIQDQDAVNCSGSGAGRAMYLADVFKNVFATDCTVKSVADVPMPFAPPPDPLRIVSNPVRGSLARFTIHLRQVGVVHLDLCDVAGRRVRALAPREFGVGTSELSWDGRDDSGQRVRPGLYFVRARLPGRAQPLVRSLVLLP